MKDSDLLLPSIRTIEEVGDIQLSSIQVKEEYLKEWNETSRDFVVLTKNGQLISNSLYRVGGIGSKPNGKDYFMLLKYVEDYYSDEIMKMSRKDEKYSEKDKKHLSGKWCILDKNGVEKVVVNRSLDYPSLINNSCIYCIGNKYYNIESGYLYCESYKRIESSEFIFLENHYDKDLSKKGVIKINKLDGTYQIFK